MAPEGERRVAEREITHDLRKPLESILSKEGGS